MDKKKEKKEGPVSRVLFEKLLLMRSAFGSLQNTYGILKYTNFWFCSYLLKLKFAFFMNIPELLLLM